MTPTEFFAGTEFVECSAPGRVNLLGEHTDYNDGYVLPIAIPQRTHVAAARLAPQESSRVYSRNLDENTAFRHGGVLPDGFARYVEGCLNILEEQGIHIPPVAMYVSSEVPMGAGLSSSAALEVATMRAMRKLLSLTMDDQQIALLSQQAEIRYAGVNCGIMDQMASSLADTEHMLFLDTKTLDRKLLPFPANAELIVIDSGVPRTLATSKYNDRRAECQESARMLGHASLRDVTSVEVLEHLPPVLKKRARHVVTENQRVLQAVSNTLSAKDFGVLMNASHASLRDDYEVSIDALDILCRQLCEHPTVYGARLTGAGFGGACIALCEKGQGSAIARTVVDEYNARHANHPAAVLLPNATR